MCCSSSSVSLPCERIELEDRGAALIELTQIDEALGKLAQLRVVEAAGDLLAIARDERHRRALVDELDRRLGLFGLGADFRGDQFGDASVVVSHLVLGFCEFGGATLVRPRIERNRVVVRPPLPLRGRGLE